MNWWVDMRRLPVSSACIKQLVLVDIDLTALALSARMYVYTH